MSIGDDQFHPAEAPSVQRTQEGQPEGAVLTGAHVHAQYLPLTLAVYTGGHHHADVDDPPALTDLWGQSVQPHVGIGTTVQRSSQEVLHHLIQVPVRLRRT